MQNKLTRKARRKPGVRPPVPAAKTTLRNELKLQDEFEMKNKAFLLVVFSSVLLFCVIENIPAQNTQPIIGYDKVPWGSSYDAVKRAYPALSEEWNFYDNDGTSMAELRGEGIINARYFNFYNDKLYCVQVTYKTNILSTDVINVIERIIQVYGLFDESRWEPGWGNKWILS
jgi:hypothetical protein